jgi:transcriptional regulator with XRE-family HTH domain
VSLVSVLVDHKLPEAMGRVRRAEMLEVEREHGQAVTLSNGHDDRVDVADHHPLVLPTTIVDGITTTVLNGGGVVNDSLGTILRDARTAHGLSQQEVADRARCSPGYVHKLEMDRVRTPSPRVLAGLAEALAVSYGELMRAAGYEHTDDARAAEPIPGAVKRYSNAHIVQLLEQLQAEVRQIHELTAALANTK